MVPYSIEKLKAFVKELMEEKMIENLYDFQLILDGGKVVKERDKFVRYLADGNKVTNNCDLDKIRSKFHKHYNSTGEMSINYAFQIEGSFHVDAKYFITDNIQLSNNVLVEYKSLSVKHDELKKRFDLLEEKLQNDKNDLMVSFKNVCKNLINETLDLCRDYEGLINNIKKLFGGSSRKQNFVAYINNYLSISTLYLKKEYNNKVNEVSNTLLDLLNEFNIKKAFETLENIYIVKNELEKEKKIVSFTKDFNKNINDILSLIDDSNSDLWVENDDLIESMHDNKLIPDKEYEEYRENIWCPDPINSIDNYLILYLCNQFQNYNNFIKYSDMDGANIFMLDARVQKGIVEDMMSNYYKNGEFQLFSHPKTFENLFTISMSSLFNDTYIFYLLQEDKKHSIKALEESEKLLIKYRKN